jgi:hypothetical protein
MARHGMPRRHVPLIGAYLHEAPAGGSNRPGAAWRGRNMTAFRRRFFAPRSRLASQLPAALLSAHDARPDLPLLALRGRVRPPALGRFRYDMVAFGALLLAVVLGLVPAATAFSGLRPPGGGGRGAGPRDLGGLVRSGAVLLITRTLVDASAGAGRPYRHHGRRRRRAVGLHEQRGGAGAPDAGRHRHRAQGRVAARASASCRSVSPPYSAVWSR